MNVNVRKNSCWTQRSCLRFQLSAHDWQISGTSCCWNSASRRSVSSIMLCPDDPGVSISEGLKEGLGAAETRDAHWASNSSSEMSSGERMRVLLARILLMLVQERRLAIPIRLTPVPSRFTWARWICFRNFRPERKRTTYTGSVHLSKQNY